MSRPFYETIYHVEGWTLADAFRPQPGWGVRRFTVKVADLGEHTEQELIDAARAHAPQRHRLTSVTLYPADGPERVIWSTPPDQRFKTAPAGVTEARDQTKAPSGTDAAPLVSEPAVQVDAPLPPMPTHAGRMEWESLRFGKPGFTADQMREYVLADRRQRAAEQPNSFHQTTASGVCDVQTALSDVAAERERQKATEGWTAEHDDEHDSGEIAAAAACYAMNAAAINGTPPPGLYAMSQLWPWHESWFKCTTPRRDLVKAGALILAEIERLDRKTAK